MMGAFAWKIDLVLEYHTLIKHHSKIRCRCQQIHIVVLVYHLSRFYLSSSILPITVMPGPAKSSDSISAGKRVNMLPFRHSSSLLHDLQRHFPRLLFENAEAILTETETARPGGT